MFGLIGWWSGLPWWLRYGVAFLLLGISTAFFFMGKIWPWGWAVGGVLLLFSGKSESEKKGYRF